ASASQLGWSVARLPGARPRGASGALRAARGGGGGGGGGGGPGAPATTQDGVKMDCIARAHTRCPIRPGDLTPRLRFGLGWVDKATGWDNNFDVARRGGVCEGVELPGGPAKGRGYFQPAAMRSRTQARNCRTTVVSSACFLT